MESTTAYGELFLRRSRTTREGAWDADFAFPRFVEMPSVGPPLRPFSIYSYLNRVYMQPGEQPGAVGFKLMYAQLRRLPELIAYFMRHRVRIIHLVRRNHLDALISNALRSKTGRTHVLAGEAPPEPTQIELDTKTLAERLAERDRLVRHHQRLLRWCRLPHLEVSYEDLCRNPSHFDPIWEFLCVNDRREVPASKLMKMRKGSHADVLLNYEEVKAALSGSIHAGLVE